MTTGLINIGNTCYLNSALQCLVHTKPLMNYLLSEEFNKDINLSRKEYPLCKEFYKLLYNMNYKTSSIIKPDTFKNALGKWDRKYLTYQQQDSSEVLSYILDIVHIGISYPVKIAYSGIPKNDKDNKMIESIKTWSNMYWKQYSHILEIFYGQFISTIECGNCNFQSITYDPFNTVKLELVGNNIYDCLDNFSKNEILSVGNEWKCEKCDKMSDNTKKRITFWKAPNILIIVLKRFNNKMRKLDTPINLPINDLDLSNYIEGYENPIYDLYGLINHTGNAYGGHYYAYCKNNNGKWYECNDTIVSEMKDITSDKMKYVYIAFYEKRKYQ